MLRQLTDPEGDMDDQDQLRAFCQRPIHEPDHPQQNPTELHAVKFLKDHSQVLLDWTGAPEDCWLLACEYIANVHNICADETIGNQIPREV